MPWPSLLLEPCFDTSSLFFFFFFFFFCFSFLSPEARLPLLRWSLVNKEQETDAREKRRCKKRRTEETEQGTRAQHNVCGMGWARDRESGAASPVMSFLILLCTFFSPPAGGV
jgi:hypothetical protein